MQGTNHLPQISPWPYIGAITTHFTFPNISAFLEGGCLNLKEQTNVSLTWFHSYTDSFSKVEFGKLTVLQGVPKTLAVPHLSSSQITLGMEDFQGLALRKMALVTYPTGSWWFSQLPVGVGVLWEVFVWEVGRHTRFRGGHFQHSAWSSLNCCRLWFWIVSLPRPTPNSQSWKTDIAKQMSLGSMTTAESRPPQSLVLLEGQITGGITRGDGVVCPWLMFSQC